MNTTIYIIENALGFLSIFFNSFLIFLALKISYVGKDIKLIICLASSEVLITICFLIDFIHYLTIGTPLINEPLSCQILGYLTSMFFYFEVMFNIMLAMERYYKIIQKKLHKYFFVPLHINTAFSLASMVWVSASWLFEPAPGGLVCMTALNKHPYSAVIYFYFVGGFTGGMIIILIYYYKLASTIGRFQEIIRRESEDDTRSSKFIKFQTFKSVRLRLYIIIGVYGILMSLSGLLHILEGVLAFYLTKNNQSVVLANQLAQLFGILGLLANPIILLSLHTGIAREFKKFISSFKS